MVSKFVLFPAVIASGQSVSADVDTGGATVLMIGLPSAWTAADLTFQVGDGLGGWMNLHSADGTEYTVKAAAGRCVLLPPADFARVRYLRVRSGTSATPVAQAAERTVQLHARQL